MCTWHTIEPRVCKSSTITYMLDDPRFESQQEQEIASSPQLSRPALGPTQPPVQWVMHPFLRVKLQGMG
jgi:hypothetical protein